MLAVVAVSLLPVAWRLLWPGNKAPSSHALFFHTSVTHPYFQQIRAACIPKCSQKSPTTNNSAVILPTIILATEQGVGHNRHNIYRNIYLGVT